MANSMEASLQKSDMRSSRNRAFFPEVPGIQLIGVKGLRLVFVKILTN